MVDPFRFYGQKGGAVWGVNCHGRLDAGKRGRMQVVLIGGAQIGFLQPV